MMVRIGEFFFKYRNGVFPVLYTLVLFSGLYPICTDASTKLLLRAGGMIIALSGVMLRTLTIGLAYIRRGGKNRKVFAKSLVQEGLFSHCRNPLYVGNLLMAFGAGLVSNSMPFLIIGMPVLTFAYFCIVMAEERFLRKQFGVEFQEYCARVNRFVPTLKGLGQTIQSMSFNWKRVLAKDYPTAFGMIAGLIGLMMLDNFQTVGTATFASTEFRTLEILLALTIGTLLVLRILKKMKILTH